MSTRRLRCAGCGKAQAKEEFPADAVFSDPSVRVCNDCERREKAGSSGDQAVRPSQAPAAPVPVPVRPPPADPVPLVPYPTTPIAVPPTNPASTANGNVGLVSACYQSPGDLRGALGALHVNYQSPRPQSSLASSHDGRSGSTDPGTPHSTGGRRRSTAGGGEGGRLSVSFTEKVDSRVINDTWDLGAARAVSRTTVHRGKYLEVDNVTYLTANGSQKNWETVTRCDRGVSGTKGVVVIALVEKRGCPKSVVLVRQFRPAVGKVCVELPGGFVEQSDASVEDAALRKLKDETGYIGRVSGSTPIALFSDAGFTDISVRTVFVQVNGDDPVNRRNSFVDEAAVMSAASTVARSFGSARSDSTASDSAAINVELVPMTKLKVHLDAYGNKPDMCVDARLYMFALGAAVGPGLMI